jgi:hypothetical protein
MGVLERQAILAAIDNEILLTRRQKKELRQWANGILMQVEAAIGMQVILCARLNRKVEREEREA